MSSVVTYTVPMHQGEHLVSLEEVLGAIDGAGLEWRLSWLEAMYQRDPGLNVLELEAKTRDQQGGLLLTDGELRALAKQIGQVIDGELHGFREGSSHDPEVAALVEVVAFDGTEWTISVSGAARGRVDENADFLRGL